MTTINHGNVAGALALIDRGHAALHEQQRHLEDARIIHLLRQGRYSCGAPQSY